MFILEMAGGILVGAVIVFVGVWMVQSWEAAGRVARCVMLTLLTTALSVAWISFIKVVSAEFLWGLGAAASAFLLCSFLLGLYRVRRERWTRRPERWRAWLLRETGRALFLPMATVVVGASILSTIALFANMQKGPQPGPLLFDLSIITAACWALVTVGGVWARRRTENR